MLVVMGVEQRQLLMAVGDVAGVVNVERDATRRRRVRRDLLIDQRVGQADRVLEARRVLHARQRRLRAQIGAGLRQPPAGQPEGGVGARRIEIVGVFIPAGDGVDAGPDHVGAGVENVRGIARVGEAARQPLRQPRRCSATEAS